MLLFEHVVGFAFRKSSLSMISPALLILPLLLMAGCTGEGAEGPMIASLSTPTDETGAVGPAQSQGSDLADDGEEDPTITMTATSTGVSAHVSWVHPPDMNVAGYNVYYRKQPAEPGSEESASAELASEDSSSDEASSCSSGEYQAVEAPAVTITGLEPDTRYAFAIRAFNESESLCSNEIVMLTPSAQS